MRTIPTSIIWPHERTVVSFRSECPKGRTFERLMEVRAIGVTRVGATATKQILDDAKAKLGL